MGSWTAAWPLYVGLTRVAFWAPISGEVLYMLACLGKARPEKTCCMRKKKRKGKKEALGQSAKNKEDLVGMGWPSGR